MLANSSEARGEPPDFMRCAMSTLGVRSGRLARGSRRENRFHDITQRKPRTRLRRHCVLSLLGCGKDGSSRGDRGRGSYARLRSARPAQIRRPTEGSTARRCCLPGPASRSEIRADIFSRAARLRSVNTRESACLGEEPYANATEPGSTLRNTGTQRLLKDGGKPLPATYSEALGPLAANSRSRSLRVRASLGGTACGGRATVYI